MWSIYTYEYIQTFICPISMIANIFRFSLFLKNGYKWLLIVPIGSICVKKHTKYGYCQVSPKQSEANIPIFENIWIFWTNIFICQNICRFFLGQNNSEIHSLSFYPVENIRIFIRWISMITNIFGYSFVQNNDIRPKLLNTSLNEWELKNVFCWTDNSNLHLL